MFFLGRRISIITVILLISCFIAYSTLARESINAPPQMTYFQHNKTRPITPSPRC